MIVTELPSFLEIEGKKFEIKTDFRDIIKIFSEISDEKLNDIEKIYIILDKLFLNSEIFGVEDIFSAFKKAKWFLDGGKDYSENSKDTPKIFDWEQDFDFIISAVDQSVKTVETVLDLKYMHWWTFLRKLSERKDTRLDSIITIRDKLNRHEKLDEFERRILSENHDLIFIKNNEMKKFEEEMWGV